MTERGRIKLINFERGFGFVAPDAGGSKDIFFHISKLPADYEPRKGDLVEFIRVAERDRDGFWARDIRFIEQRVAPDEAREHGTVLRWNDEKGFGFIAPSDPHSDAKDVYANMRQTVDGWPLKIGDRVTFRRVKATEGGHADWAKAIEVLLWAGKPERSVPRRPISRTFPRTE